MSDRSARTEPHDADQRERWVIILRDAGGSEQPVGRRVAGLLKSALRGWKLRAVSVSSTTLEEQIAASRGEVLRLEAAVQQLRRKLSKDLEKAKPGVKSNGELTPTSGSNSKTETLASAGLSTQQASRCETIASIPEETFEEIIGAAKQSGKVRALRRIGEISRDLEKSAGGKNPAATLPPGGRVKAEVLDAAGEARTLGRVNHPPTFPSPPASKPGDGKG